MAHVTGPVFAHPPSFLQEHIGDVNPGDGSDWRGEIRQTVAAITPALKQAIADAGPLHVDCLRTRSMPFNVPFDMERFEQWVDEYRRDSSKCKSGQWVDAGFAGDWYHGNELRDRNVKHLPTTLSAIRFGLARIRPSWCPRLSTRPRTSLPPRGTCRRGHRTARANRWIAASHPSRDGGTGERARPRAWGNGQGIVGANAR